MNLFTGGKYLKSKYRFFPAAVENENASSSSSFSMRNHLIRTEMCDLTMTLEGENTTAWGTNCLPLYQTPLQKPRYAEACVRLTSRTRIMKQIELDVIKLSVVFFFR